MTEAIQAYNNKLAAVDKEICDYKNIVKRKGQPERLK